MSLRNINPSSFPFSSNAVLSFLVNDFGMAEWEQALFIVWAGASSIAIYFLYALGTFNYGLLGTGVSAFIVSALMLAGVGIICLAYTNPKAHHEVIYTLPQFVQAIVIQFSGNSEPHVVSLDEIVCYTLLTFIALMAWTIFIFISWNGDLTWH